MILKNITMFCLVTFGRLNFYCPKSKNNYGLSKEEAKRIKKLVTRQPIKSEVIEELLINSNFLCCCCKMSKHGVVVHHIKEYSITQDNSYDNLVVLCQVHHDQAHKRHGLTFSLTEKELKAAKKSWEKQVKNHNKTVLGNSMLTSEIITFGLQKYKFDVKSKKFNIALLPFEELEGMNTSKMENTIKRRLLQKSDKENLDIDIKYLDILVAPESFSEAGKIGNELNADLVIWGEKYSDSSKGELLYVITSKDEIHIERKRQSGIKIIPSLADIKNGILQKDVDFVIYWITLVKAFNERNDLKVVDTASKIIAKLNINDIFTYNIYGQGLYGLGRFNEAIQAFKKCIKIGGNGQVVYNNLGLTYQEIGELDNAEHYYLKGLELDQYSATIYHNYGNLELTRENYILGKIYLKISLNIDDSSPKAWNSLSQGFALTKEYDMAIEAINIGLGIDSKNPFLNDTKGCVLYDLKQYKEAEKYLEIAISNKPDFATSHNTLGLVKDALGKTEEALEYFFHAIELNPNYDSSYFNLIHLLYNKKLFDIILDFGQ